MKLTPFWVQKLRFMDIDLLSKMVKELILDSDRVVLPGLGCFVAEIVPSSFSDKGYTINPPYRRLYFRSKPDQGSELAELYASGNNIEPSVAAKIIGDFVAELKSVLHSKKVVVFPGLGRLRATKENNIFFIADADLDIYPAGFGLEPISLKTHQETQEEVSAAVVGLKSLLVEDPMQPADVQKSENMVPEDFPQMQHEQPADEIAEVESAEAQEEIKPSDEDHVAPEELQHKEEPETETGQLPETESDPQTESDPEPIVEPAPEPSLRDTVQDESPVKKTSGRKILTVVMCVVLAVVAVFLAVLAVVGRLYPEFVDRFLYTPEELKILNQILK